MAPAPGPTPAPAPSSTGSRTGPASRRTRASRRAATSARRCANAGTGSGKNITPMREKSASKGSSSIDAASPSTNDTFGALPRSRAASQEGLGRVDPDDAALGPDALAELPGGAAHAAPDVEHGRAHQGFERVHRGPAELPAVAVDHVGVLDPRIAHEVVPDAVLVHDDEGSHDGRSLAADVRALHRVVATGGAARARRGPPPRAPGHRDRARAPRPARRGRPADRRGARRSRGARAPLARRVGRPGPRRDRRPTRAAPRRRAAPRSAPVRVGREGPARARAREALRLGHRDIGTEHLALALAAQPDSEAVRVLAGLHVERAELRARVLELLARPAPGARGRPLAPSDADPDAALAGDPGAARARRARPCSSASPTRASARCRSGCSAPRAARRSGPHRRARPSPGRRLRRRHPRSPRARACAPRRARSAARPHPPAARSSPGRRAR